MSDSIPKISPVEAWLRVCKLADGGFRNEAINTRLFR